MLGPLPQEELADFIAGRFETTGRDGGPALGWLLRLADGHPQRAMLLAHLLWREVEAGGAGDEDAWGGEIDSDGGRALCPVARELHKMDGEAAHRDRVTVLEL